MSDFTIDIKVSKVDSPIFDQLVALLSQMAALATQPNLNLLSELIILLQETDKVKHANVVVDYQNNMALLVEILQKNPLLAEQFTLFILSIIDQYQQISLYTDIGILTDNGFFSELYRLMGNSVLPLLPETGSLLQLFNQLFASKKNQAWLDTIDESLWYDFLNSLQLPKNQQVLINRLRANVLKAITILSYRISGIGLHWRFVQAYPKVLENHSSFIEQNIEVIAFVALYRKHYLVQQNEQNLPLPPVDSSQIFVLLAQGQDVVNTIRKRIYKTGISIRLTNMLVRLEQNISRLELLLTVLSKDEKAQKQAMVSLIHELFQGSKNRYRFRYLFHVNTELLSKKVTDNASKVGEHYISTDAKGYKKMYQKAAIGGFLIAFMATLKILGYSLKLPPVGTAFLNSMIYGLGFVVIHIVGGTVATKQPAMTAAAIASTISQSSNKKNNQLNKLAELIVDIMRTQFIAIMGNVTIAMPIALMISMTWLYATGTPLVNAEKADYLLHDLNPFTSLAVFHAAIAGLFLYVSGLIAGYYDNLAMHNQIGERIRQHPKLKKYLQQPRLNKIGDFIERNLGALMSNFMFGVFLGSTATLGLILGLPLDIRHIAFASANFVHGVFNAYANLGALPDIGIILVSFFGVFLIGLINLLVSFSLALITALKAKQVKMLAWKEIFKLVASHFLSQPSDFFIPRKQPMQYDQIDNDGNMIFEDKNPQENSQEKLTASQIEEKKQAIKDKATDKPNDTANKLPK